MEKCEAFRKDVLKDKEVTLHGWTPRGRKAEATKKAEDQQR